MAARAFTAAFCYQVNQLGNVVRGLEMIAEYLEHHWTRGAQHTLAQDCRRLLAHIPRGRLPHALVMRLHTLSLLNADETSGAQDPGEKHRTPSNAVLLLLVDQAPQPSGLVRELWIEPAQPYAQRRRFPLEAADDFCRALTAGCLAAAQALEQVGILPVSTIPDDYVFHVASGAFGGNPRMQGASVWLAGALSYVALWGGLPLPGVVAAMGYLEPDGQIGVLGGVAEKLRACLRERPDVARILVLSREEIPEPYADNPRVIAVTSLEEAVQAVWGTAWQTRVVPPAPSVYAAVERALHTYNKEGRFPEALVRFAVLSRFFSQAPQFPPRFRFLCDWRWASCHMHLGRPDRASALWQRLAAEVPALWQAGELSSEDYTNFFASYGVYLQDIFAFQQGARLLGEALEHIAAYRVTRVQRAKLYGTLGQLLMFHEAFEAAERMLWQAYELIDEEEKPRNCTYLGQLYILWQRYPEAQRYLDESRRRNAEVHLPEQQRINAIFHGVWQARLSFACSDWAQAIAAAEEVLALRPLDYPGCLAWKWKGVAHLARGEESVGHEALQESLVWHPPYVFRDSPNVRLIQQTARVAMVEWCMHTGRDCPQGLAFHVGEIVAALDAFPDAHPHFVAELAVLQQWLCAQSADTACLRQTLRTLAAKIVY